MNNITQKDLQAVADRINRVAATPLTYSDNQPDGKFKSNIGNYHLSGAYSGFQLVQTVNEAGGIRSITHGFLPKREVYNMMQAYCLGLESC